MGYLTTITFRNDCAGEIERNPARTLAVISHAISGVQRNQGRDYASIGSCANPVIIQKTRHADDKTLYVHAGNTVFAVDDDLGDWALETAIQEMEYHLKRLKKLKKAK